MSDQGNAILVVILVIVSLGALIVNLGILGGAGDWITSVEQRITHLEEQAAAHD